MQYTVASTLSRDAWGWNRDHVVFHRGASAAFEFPRCPYTRRRWESSGTESDSNTSCPSQGNALGSQLRQSLIPLELLMYEARTSDHVPFPP